MSVLVDAGAIVGGGSGNTGWSARSSFLLNDFDQTNRTHNGVFLGVGNATARTKQAQSFTTGSGYSIASVLLLLLRSGTPTDNYFVTIETDSANTPSGTVLATSGNMVGTHTVTSLAHLVRFDFASPAALSNGTKYWICLQRSGAVDGTNFQNWVYSNNSAYASGGISTHNGTSWGAESGTNDFLFSTLKSTKSVYQVTQDTKLHVWKSTDDGATWAELDNANAPAVNSSTKPFSADHHWEARRELCGDGLNPFIHVGYFSNTNTARVKQFNPITALWAGDLTGADFSADVDFNRSIRVAATAWDMQVEYTSLADDADIEFVIYDGSGQVQLLAVASASASTIADAVTDSTSTVDNGGTRYISNFHYDVENNDFTVRTHFYTTLNTAADLDTTAADVETEHASAVYQVYSDQVIAAFIDADGTLEERVATLALATPTLATQHQVSSSTSYAGRSLATCEHEGDLLIFACTGSAIDVHKDAGATGTWAAQTGWLSGLTNAVVSGPPVSIPGVGVLVAYVDGGDTKVNLWTAAVAHPLTGSVAGSSATSATTITLSHPLTGDISGDATATATQLTVGHPLTGSVAGDAAVTATTLTLSHPLSGDASGASAASAASLIVGHPLIASIAGSSSATAGSLTLSHPLSGTANGTSTASASALTVGHVLTGQVSGASAATADRLIVGHPLIGAAEGLSATAGELEAPGHPLTGVVAGTAATSATRIMLSHPLSGAVVATSLATGQRITFSHPLTADVLGSSAASADRLRLSHPLTGDAAGVAVVIGGFSVIDTLDWAPHFLGPRRSNELAGVRSSNDFDME